MARQTAKGDSRKNSLPECTGAVAEISKLSPVPNYPLIQIGHPQPRAGGDDWGLGRIRQDKLHPEGAA